MTSAPNLPRQSSGSELEPTRIREVVLKRSGIRALLSAALAFVTLASFSPHARAAGIAPRVVAAARAAGQEALLSREIGRYQLSRAWGVDKIYPKFALDLAKYPRGGVAHRNLLVVLCDFNGDDF